MLGYYKNQELTNEIIDKNNWFNTGDIGQFNDSRFLKITGRKKEMFKTSGGKYIIPTLLENELKQSRFIEQVMVVGEGEKMPAAFIQPNFEFVQEWINKKKKNVGNSAKEIATSEEVIKRIQKELDKCNQHFGKWEQIKVFRLTEDAWTPDAGHLTPTMKMKRSVIKEKYIDLYDDMYRR